MKREQGKVIGPSYRITVLTERMLRLEYEEEGHFTDERTIRVVHRNWKQVEFTVEETREGIRLETSHLILMYNEQPFSPQGMTITMKESGATWNYGDPYIDTTWNLGGTARTLDLADGPVPLEKGLFSRLGCTLLDDSDACLLVEGEVVERRYREKDLYFLAYGTDVRSALKDYACLTGKTPMIPRYALGNWWSKYEKYTEESYLNLLQHFEKEQVPLSVAVIDMDWHVTEIDPKYGNAWTGFTWNRGYFPDYRRFLAKLHEKGMAVTLNLHPADGIRACEEMYEKAADAMGVDPETEEPLPFDLTNPQFRRAYFEEVLHPYEEAGVDFWWIDWQQGTRMGTLSVDPLWLCNHYHVEDQLARGKRPMILSRYAGWGSHRYPIGFSGDTKTTWASLAFQPYFTQTASNIGYGWWSHDIGGHMLGDKDMERYVRWVQFGVFSPIMRLHSSASPFFVKEPWKLEEPYRSIVDRFMRLRHRLIPYLYTQNYLSWKEDLPLIRPLYYENPEDPRSYENRCAYWFGDSMIVGAVTGRQDAELRMGSVSMFLPEGTWYDLFTGRSCQGGTKRSYYRPLDQMPVFLRAGAVVPFAGENCLEAANNPEELDIYIAPLSDGTGRIYEDDGITNSYQTGDGATTILEQRWNGREGTLTIRTKGNTAYVPAERTFHLHLLGALEADGWQQEETGVCLTVNAAGGESMEIRIPEVTMRKRNYVQEVFELVERAWTEVLTKEKVYAKAKEYSLEAYKGCVQEMDISPVMKDAIFEILENCVEA